VGESRKRGLVRGNTSPPHHPPTTHTLPLPAHTGKTQCSVPKVCTCTGVLQIRDVAHLSGELGVYMWGCKLSSHRCPITGTPARLAHPLGPEPPSIKLCLVSPESMQRSASMGEADDRLRVAMQEHLQNVMGSQIYPGHREGVRSCRGGEARGAELHILAGRQGTRGGGIGG
jgi:hypothetical protein